MHVENCKVTFAGARIQPLKNKFMSARYFPQGQVFRGRTHKNQVIVLRIIQSEEAASFNAYATIEFNAYATIELAKKMVQVANGQHLSDPGVMIHNMI